MGRPATQVKLALASQDDHISREEFVPSRTLSSIGLYVGPLLCLAFLSSLLSIMGS